MSISVEQVKPDCDSQFENPVSQALYELATCTLTSDPDYKPHPKALKKIFDQNHIALWDNWQAMALQDNVVFLSTESTPFTNRGLPHNVAHDYFHLYLLTLFQKFRLSFFAGELIRDESDPSEQLDNARSLWSKFVRFRSRYWFAEVTLKSQGQALHKKFQQGLGVQDLFESTDQKVHALRQYDERQADLELAESARSLQQNMEKNISIVAIVEKRIEWMEVLIVSIYFCELAHIIVPKIEFLCQYEWQSILASGVFGLVLALGILRPWRH